MIESSFWLNLFGAFCVCGFRYTLWNAEYRVSLTRNFDIPTDPRKEDDRSSKDDVRFGSEKGVSEDLGNCVEELERMSPQVFGELSPEALNYIQHLQSELTSMKEVSPNVVFVVTR